MTLTDLRYLVTLARLRHFGRAAEACHISQPTLSVAIKKLEAELGVSVFERHRHELFLTAEGEAIVRQAERVLEEADALTLLARDSVDEFRRPLRLGAIFTIGPYLFPTLVQRLRAQGSGLALYLEENYTHVLIDALSTGRLDAILIATPLNAPDTETLELFSEDFDLLLPADHPWQAQPAIPPGNLANESLLLLGEGHCFRDQVLEACGSPPGPSELAPGSSLETLRHMVASHLGLTLVPASAAPYLTRFDASVVTRPLSPAPHRTVRVCWRRRFPRRRALQALLAALKTVDLPGTQVCTP